MLDIFYPVCRDLLELQRLLREMLPKVVGAQLAYRESASNGNRGRMELHAVALPVLKDALQRQFYSVCALSDVDGSALDGAAAVATVDDRDERRSKSTVFELPLYTKYLREIDPLPYSSRRRLCEGEWRALRVHKRGTAAVRAAEAAVLKLKMVNAVALLPQRSGGSILGVARSAQERQTLLYSRRHDQGAPEATDERGGWFGTHAAQAVSARTAHSDLRSTSPIIIGCN